MPTEVFLQQYKNPQGMCVGGGKDSFLCCLSPCSQTQRDRCWWRYIPLALLLAKNTELSHIKNIYPDPWCKSFSLSTSQWYNKNMQQVIKCHPRCHRPAAVRWARRDLSLSLAVCLFTRAVGLTNTCRCFAEAWLNGKSALIFLCHCSPK